MILLLLSPFACFSQLPDSCDVEFEFTINSESRNVKFTQVDKEVNVVSYYWDFGDGTYSVSEEPNHSYSQADTFIVCLTVITDNNCTNTFCDTVNISLTEQTIYNLSGTVVTNTSVLPLGFALLIQKENNDYIYKSVTDIYEGHYSFPDIEPGMYYIQAIPVFHITGLYFPFYLPTYSGSRLKWQDAQSIYVYSPNSVHNIQLCSFNGIITGDQSVHGSITYSDTTLYEEDVFNFDWENDTPIPNPLQNAINIPVYLYDATGNCVKACLSNFDGEFIFENLAYGKYFISAEKAGVVSDMITANLQTSGDSQNFYHITLNAYGFLGANEITVDKNGFNFYPVPSNDIVFVQNRELSDFTIYNSLGEEIEHYSSDVKQIDISGFTNGIYFVRSSTGQKSYLIKK